MTSTGKKTTVTFNPNTLKYTVNHNGKSTETTVTNISSEAEQWFKLYCKNKIKATVIGMAMRHKLNTSNEPFHLRTSEAATLHLYVDDKCLIIQLLNMDSFSNSLKDFFMNPMLIFAGIHVDNINNRLFKECGFRACKTLDIRDHARMKWPGKFSEYPELKVLASDVANVHIDTAASHIIDSKWEARMLSLEQVECATMEAYASYCVGHKILLGD